MNEENPVKLYSAIFPYEVKFSLEADERNTEIIIKTKSEEFYTARSPEDCKEQKILSDKYSQEAWTKHILNFVRDEVWSLEPENVEITYTGDPIFTEMPPERLETFQRELING